MENGNVPAAAAAAAARSIARSPHTDTPNGLWCVKEAISTTVH